MAEIIAHFTVSGVPLVAPGNVPTIRIRRTDTGALVVTDLAMTELGDGNFLYTFVPVATLEYSIRCDGDPTAAGQTTVQERYQFAALSGITEARIETDIPLILADTADMQPKLGIPVVDVSADIAAVQADTNDIQTRLPAALVGGAMDSDVSNIQAAALTQINTQLEVTSGHGAGSWQSATVSPAAVATAVWSEVLPGVFAAGQAGERLATTDDRVDQALSTTESNIRGADSDDLKDISDEIAAVQADTNDIQTRLPAALVGGRMDSDVAILQAAVLTAINTQLEVTSGHGAGLWTGASSPTVSAIVAGVWAELLPGAFGAGSAGKLVGDNVDAAVSTRATQAQILSDATPFAGANVDTTISSRATPAQITAAQNAIIAELARLIISEDTTAAVGSSPTEVRTPLTQANDFFNNMQIMVINAAGVAVRNVNDYANVNGAFTVDALPFTPALSDPVIILSRTGSVPVNLVAIAGAVWNALRVTYNGVGSFGESIRLSAAGLQTDAAQEIRDEILSDSTPFPGANIDQALSTTESNIRGSDADDLKDISDQIDGLPAANDVVLTAAHGAGLWTGASSASDWSAAERQQIRSALGIDGSKVDAVDGQLQQFHIAATATVAAGGSAIEVRTDLTQADGFWNNMVMIVEDVGGTGERVARNIDNYTNSNGALFAFGGLPFTPANGDRVFIVARTGSLRDDNGPIGCL